MRASIIVGALAILLAASSAHAQPSSGCCQLDTFSCAGEFCGTSQSGCYNTDSVCPGTFVPGTTCNFQSGLCDAPEPGCCNCDNQPTSAQGFGMCVESFGLCAFQCNAPLYIPGGECSQSNGCQLPDESSCEAPPKMCPPEDLSNAIFCQPGVPCAGTAAADVICGTPGDDLIMAKGGNDIVCAGNGNDRVQAGTGDDRVDSNASCGAIPEGTQAGDDDRVYGSSGDDLIRTGDGNDTVFGGQGDDRIWGEDGDDNLRGNGGVDVLVGGDDEDNASGGGTGADSCEAESESGCELDCGSTVLRTY